MENEIGTAVGVEDERPGRAQQDATPARSALFSVPKSCRAVTSRSLGGTSGAYHGRFKSVATT